MKLKQDVYENLSPDKSLFDFSDYPEDSKSIKKLLVWKISSKEK